ncbi:CDP-glucose 4,6-dehydratase [Azospirillum lipoferum]|uniref:CDP-glucose 4,6-dehydratase n=1 Tax=Azospirillum lipoferum TaxID=193 RepID=A0A5A9GIN4_AZOLI|nr:CDP-glucose 4,6-dehydratase [Azospirillum lipoferum]
MAVTLHAHDFWRGRRVFLTGHTGFKGAWLSLMLRRLGAEVTGYSLPPHTTPSLFELAGVADGMTSIIGDILDASSLARAIADCQPEIVLHLAAQPIVRLAYTDPAGTYATNVMGTLNLLEGARRVPSVRSIVVVTTDKCYLNRGWVWGYRENDPLGGNDLYSSSKACTEILTASFRHSFFPPERHGQHGVGIATARAGNVIGGGDWAPDRLVPDAIRAFTRGDTLRLRYPGAVRPWQHVLEPLEGYLRLAMRLWQDGAAHADAWNFAPLPSGERPVGWMADRLAALWGDGRVEVEQADHPHEDTVLRLDATKARVSLGWEPLFDLNETLEQTVAWYRAQAGGADAGTLTRDQIDAYLARGADKAAVFL